MTLSSTSRQQRKSMLPKPRPSSRISARRVASGDTTSRIARRVPSPLIAMSCNNGSSTTTQAVRVAALADYNLPLPEAGPRRAGSPSRIPWSGEIRISSDLCPTTDRSEASSSLMSRTPSPSPEVKTRGGVNVQYPTPPASAEIKHERFFKGQEGRGLGQTNVNVPAAQHQDAPVVAAGAAVPPARHPSRRPASVSTTLALTNTFSRADNASPRDASGAGIPALNTWKKSAFMNSNFSGKENRRPRMYTRVRPPPVTSAATIPPRSIRRTVVAQPPSRAGSFRESPPSPRPLVIRKQLPLAAVGSSPVRSASGASGALPVVGPVSAGIQALIGDIDCFAKEWTEMFDELSAGAEDPEDRLSKLDASIRIRPTRQPEDTGRLQADNTAAAAGKGTTRQLQPGPSRSIASVSTLQASTPAGTNAETVYFDVTPASLTRWQHRDKSLVKDTPEDRPERDLPVASETDPQTDKVHHLLKKAVLRNASLQTTPQASRHLPSLPEISQSSIISSSHLVEATSVILSNREDEATNLPQTISTTLRGIDRARRNGILQQARCYSSATVPNVSSSPSSNVASLSAVSSPLAYSSSPRVNLRANDFVTQCAINATSTSDAAVPTRSPSLHGLRAIFKRTSAGLTGSHRQRAESLKERISEPRVLSLGSISISNLRDAGVVSGCALPMGQEESSTNTGDLARITAVK